MNPNKGPMGPIPMISTEESVTKQLKILQDGRPLNGKYYNEDGNELPW